MDVHTTPDSFTTQLPHVFIDVMRKDKIHRRIFSVPVSRARLDECPLKPLFKFLELEMIKNEISLPQYLILLM
jgi:hypothetical protein